LIRTLADLQYRFLDRMRHREAFEVADHEGTEPDFAAMRGARQCLVVTFKGSGAAVPTPVNFGLSDDGLLYFRSEPRSAKVRRIRRNPHVRVCACDMRGKPRGRMSEGVARVVPEGENERADVIIASNWSAPMKVVERRLDLLPLEMVHVEVKPAGREVATV
jgi:PPOX class probable F420-dependent enzyme